MKNWKVKLTSGGEKPGEIKKTGIFQGNSLSPTLFFIILIRLSTLPALEIHLDSHKLLRAFQRQTVFL